MLFKDLGLSAELLRAVQAHGYSEATPIQRQAIPMVLTGKDVLAGAQTGTGKTAGFTLPILQRLQESDLTGKLPRVLILTPTRELAAQVQQSVLDYGRHLPFRSLTIFGGVSINPQKAKLRKGVDIIVATPGRLLDHMQQHTVDLSAVEMLVLDEADRMLDMGFIRDMRKIFAGLPKARQTLLFSATFNKEIRFLANDLLKDPVEVHVSPRNTTAERVSQIVYPVDKHRKRELLSHRIGAGNWQQVLVFTRTKHGANRLAEQLSKDGLKSVAIHGDKSQGARTRALAEFKAGKVRVMVATDIAARGLDIEKLPHVVNYELPNVPEDYVHRIGRTARAGQDGHAISLVSAEEQKLLHDIEKLLKAEIEKEIVAGYEPEHWSNTLAKSANRSSDKHRRRSGGSRNGSGKRSGHKRGKSNGADSAVKHQNNAKAKPTAKSGNSSKSRSGRNTSTSGIKLSVGNGRGGQNRHSNRSSVTH